MQQLPRIIFLFGFITLSSWAQGLSVGVYWAFQLEDQNVSVDEATFSLNPSVNSWPHASISFSYDGTNPRNFSSYGGVQTAYDGTEWIAGRAFGWNSSSDASYNNTFEITIDTTAVENLNLRLRYRLNAAQSTYGPVNGFSAFEYSLDGGTTFVDVPGVSLLLDNNQEWSNLWLADLSLVSTIENAGLVTLRWSLPDLIQVLGTQIRMDDLEILGTYDPVIHTNSNSEILELSTTVKTYIPSKFSASSVDYALSGADAASFNISSDGVLTFLDAPVFADKSSYSLVVEMTDASDDYKVEHEAVSLRILESAAIKTRERYHPRGQYNVLFIPIDDLRPLLNIYGEKDPLNPTTIDGNSGTPNFDRLANSGVTFLNAHCQQAICTASRVSFLTGLRPDTTRNWHLNTKFRDVMPEVTTLPQHFKDNGYVTYGVGKIFHGSTATNQDEARSWSEGWHNPSSGRYNFYERGDNPEVWNTWDKTSQSNANDVSATDVGEFKRDGNLIEDTDYKDGRAAELAVQKIAEYAANDTRFFLGLGFQKPHLPFNAPKMYWDLYDPNNIDLSAYLGIRNMPVGSNSFTAPYGGEPTSYGDAEIDFPTVEEPDLSIYSNDIMPSVDSARHLIHGYMACVSFIDAQLGKVLRALEDPNDDGSSADSIVNNTIVIVFGDHGFHLGDHGAFWSKHSNYEISTRVPLIIRTPGLVSLGSAGSMTNAPVELVDIFPTLLDLCSMPVPDVTNSITSDITRYQILEGTTLLPLLEDPQQPWKFAAYSQYQRYISFKSNYDSNPLSAAGAGKGMGYTLRTDRYRYTEWWRTNGDYGAFGTQTFDPNASQVVANEASFVELYDYKDDPSESENLAYTQADDYVELISELRALLHDSDDSDYVGDGWKKNNQISPYNVPPQYPATKATWKSLHQSPGHSALDFADDGDPDEDGIPNLLEYAMGMHPLEYNSSFYPSITNTPEEVSIRYPQVLSRNDISLITESTSSLESPSWSPVSVVTQPLTEFKSMKEATMTKSGTKGFIRLRADDK